MTVGIIPESRPPLPRGLLIRPLVLVALGAGIFLTFDAQSSFLRPGADLGSLALALLGFAHLPFLVAVPILLRLGKAPPPTARGVALIVAAFLVGSSYLGLQEAFVASRRASSGSVFFILPAGQLVVLLMLAVLLRWWARTKAAENETAADAQAVG